MVGPQTPQQRSLWLKWRCVPNTKPRPPAAAGNRETLWGRGQRKNSYCIRELRFQPLLLPLNLPLVPPFLCLFPHRQFAISPQLYSFPPEACQFSKVDGPAAPETILSLSLLCWDSKCLLPRLFCVGFLFVFVLYSNSGIKLRSSSLLDRHCVASQALGQKALQCTIELHLPTQFQPSWWTQQDGEVGAGDTRWTVYHPLLLQFPSSEEIS